jgi:hypothetical protein
MKHVLFLLLVSLYTTFSFSQTEWKSETFHGTLKGMYFTATIDYKVDCEHATPFVRATLKDIKVYKFEYEGETYQYEYDLPIKADEGYLVLDGEITLVKGGDFNGTFELNEKHLSSKIGGGGNAMTADEFRFTNESEVTRIMGVNSCASALEKLKYTSAILEIKTLDIDKYDGDLRLNGRAINDILKEKINESASSKSNSNRKSYLEEAKEEKNEYMEQLDREERMEQNRRAESERELNQIKRSNQDPTIKSIEVAERKVDEVFDNYWDQAAIAQQEERERGFESMRREAEEQRLEGQRYKDREQRVDAYWKHLDERKKLIDPIRNEVYTFAVDYDMAGRKFYSAFSNAIRGSKSEIFILPIFQREKMDFDRETYEIYEEKKYYLKSFTPIKIDLTEYDTIKGFGAIYNLPKRIKTELEKQGYKKSWHNELVFMFNTDESVLLKNVQAIVQKYDGSILVYKHNKIDNEIIERRIYEDYLNSIETHKKLLKEKEEKQRELEERKAAMKTELSAFDAAVKAKDTSSLRGFTRDFPNSQFVDSANLILECLSTEAIKVSKSSISKHTRLMPFYSNLKDVELVIFNDLKEENTVQKNLSDFLDKLKEHSRIERVKVSSQVSKENIRKVYQLNSVKTLIIYLNKLDGPYTGDWLIGVGQMSNLEVLVFEKPLDFIPKEVEQLKKLKILSIGTKESQLPNQIYSLDNLEVLHIWTSNGLEVSESINQLKKLRLLKLSTDNDKSLNNILRNDQLEIFETQSMIQIYGKLDRFTEMIDKHPNLKYITRPYDVKRWSKEQRKRGGNSKEEIEQFLNSINSLSLAGSWISWSFLDFDNIETFRSKYSI